MRKLAFPLSLLVLFWAFVSLRGQGDAGVAELATSAAAAEAAVSIDSALSSSGVGLATVAGDQLTFAGLMSDYFAVFGILVASVILAVRRRAHLVFGQHHRRR